MNPEILKKIGAAQKQYKKGEYIFIEGNDPRYFYQIITGEVKMFNMNSEGKEFIQGVFTDNCSFGEPPLFINEPYPSNAIATKDTLVYRVLKSTFFKMLKEDSTIESELLQLLARRLFNKATTSREIINSTPEMRLIAFLCAIKKKSTDTQDRYLVPFTRQQIANFTGLRVETVIRTLSKMKEKKIVEIINHKLYI